MKSSRFEGIQYMFQRPHCYLVLVLELFPKPFGSQKTLVRYFVIFLSVPILHAAADKRPVAPSAAHDTSVFDTQARPSRSLSGMIA